jgi:hypothetical protein
MIRLGCGIIRSSPCSLNVAPFRPFASLIASFAMPFIGCDDAGVDDGDTAMTGRKEESCGAFANARPTITRKERLPKSEAGKGECTFRAKL